MKLYIHEYQKSKVELGISGISNLIFPVDTNHLKAYSILNIILTSVYKSMETFKGLEKNIVLSAQQFNCTSSASPDLVGTLTPQSSRNPMTYTHTIVPTQLNCHVGSR